MRRILLLGQWPRVLSIGGIGLASLGLEGCAPYPYYYCAPPPMICGPGGSVIIRESFPISTSPAPIGSYCEVPYSSPTIVSPGGSRFGPNRVPLTTEPVLEKADRASSELGNSKPKSVDVPEPPTDPEVVRPRTKARIEPLSTQPKTSSAWRAVQEDEIAYQPKPDDLNR